MFRRCSSLLILIVLSAGLVFPNGKIKAQDAVSEPEYSNQRALIWPDEPATWPHLSYMDKSVPRHWWKQVIQCISEKEYFVRQRNSKPGSADFFQAANRAHNFRTSFTSRSLRIAPRMRSATSWEIGFRLAAYGYAGRMVTAKSAQIVPRNNRIEYRRKGLIEWYINNQQGLEQGFTFTEKPDENPDKTNELHIYMNITGSAMPVLDRHGQCLKFQSPEGETVLQYQNLQAYDATGRTLPTDLDLELRRLTIRVGIQDARFPVTVDPLLTNPGWQKIGDQSFTYLGYSVASAGDVNGDGYSDIIVAAPHYDLGQGEEGRVLVYLGSPFGLSTVGADYILQIPQSGAHFGHSVASAGDVNGDGYSDILIGAPDYDNGQEDEGAVFLYFGSPNGLVTSSYWSAESDDAGSRYGFSVASAGDVNGDSFSDVIVGAPDYYYGSGGIFLYYGSDNGLGSSSFLIGGHEDLGYCVSSAGDVNGDGYSDIIVGAPKSNMHGNMAGNVCLYYGSEEGILEDPDVGVGYDRKGRYGHSVSSAGDVNGDGYSDIIIGANKYDTLVPEPESGRVWVYHGSSEGIALLSPNYCDWSQHARQAGAELGHSVACAGDVNGDGFSDVIVGVPYYDSDLTDAGSVLVFHGSSKGLASEPSWQVEGEVSTAYIGLAVSSAGDVNGDGYSDVLIGSYKYSPSAAWLGMVSLYYGSPGVPAETADWQYLPDDFWWNPISVWFGSSVSNAGDVNGDGYADVIIGAPGYSFNEDYFGRGKAYIFHGSDQGFSEEPDWLDFGEDDYSYFGASVDIAGDVNGDGYDDVVIGAPRDGGGAVFVYHGSASGLPANEEIKLKGSGGFGGAVSGAGDVNGDGYADIMVGASKYSNGQDWEGAVYVYFGSKGGLKSTPAGSAESNKSYARLGYSVDEAGDVNADGYSDIIAGSPGRSGSLPEQGKVYGWYGSSSGILQGGYDWSAKGSQAHARFGSSVAGAGDVNGDGYSDIIVGAPWYNNSVTDDGLAFLYYGSTSGLADEFSWIASSNQDGAAFGSSVSAGDVNGDGYSDLALGAPYFTDTNDKEGSVTLFLGSDSGPKLIFYDWRATGGLKSNMGFGSAVSACGDVNGDGYADVLGGAPDYDHDEKGSAFMYFGNGGPGHAMRPRQLHSDNSGPIARLGLSSSPRAFRLASLAKTPFGRTSVKMEWEVKPFRADFDGADTGLSSVWQDTGRTGVELTELVDGLSPGMLYHWRLRLRYHPATIPYQPAGPWLTNQAVKGWEEAVLRTCRPIISPWLPLLLQDED